MANATCCWGTCAGFGWWLTAVRLDLRWGSPVAGWDLDSRMINGSQNATATATVKS
jgi:hypothetical protein